MGPKRFYSQNCSLFIVKFKKLGLSAPLSLEYNVFDAISDVTILFLLYSCQSEIILVTCTTVICIAGKLRNLLSHRVKHQ